MSTPIAIQLPEQLRTAIEADVADLPRWTLEAVVLEAVREGLISRGRGGELLGLGFHEREALFARRHVSYDLDEHEIQTEQEALRKMLP